MQNTSSHPMGHSEIHNLWALHDVFWPTKPVDPLVTTALTRLRRLINSLCTESSDQFALNRRLTLLFQISRTAQLRLSPTIPPWVSPRPNFHQWSQSLVPGEHGGVAFDSPPLTFSRPPKASPQDKAKKLRQFFEICSHHRQRKTRSAENQLKLPQI